MYGTMENSDTLPNYYNVLQCERTASTEELKRSYQRLVLSYHPDKTDSDKESNTFLLIQKAWSVLRDSESRKQYDARLSCQEHEDFLLYDTIVMSDMEVDSEGYHSYPCRCGGVYCFDSSEIADPKVIVPCNECSFSIQIDTTV